MENYDNARFAVAFIFFTFILSSSLIVAPILINFFSYKIPSQAWGTISLISSLLITYPLTKKFYGPDGTRKWVITHYDKTTNIRKQNSVIQAIILTFVIYGYFFICDKTSMLLREYWHIPTP